MADWIQAGKKEKGQGNLGGKRRERVGGDHKTERTRADSGHIACVRRYKRNRSRKCSIVVDIRGSGYQLSEEAVKSVRYVLRALAPVNARKSQVEYTFVLFRVDNLHPREFDALLVGITEMYTFKKFLERAPIKDKWEMLLSAHPPKKPCGYLGEGSNQERED